MPSPQRGPDAQTLLKGVLAQHADRVAIEDGTAATTYAQLEREASRLAGSIVEQRGDRLEPAVILTAGGATVTRAYVGAIMAGRTVVPVDPATPGSRLDAILGLVGPCTVLVGADAEALVPHLEAAGRTALVIEEAAASGPSLDAWLHRDPGSPYRLTFTSGSSGVPKAVVREHATLQEESEGHPSWAVPGDRVPLLFSGTRTGIGAEPMRLLTRGATLLPFDLRGEGVGRLAGWLGTVGASILATVPTVLRQLASTLGPDDVLSGLRLVQGGGEAWYWSDIARLRTHLDPACEVWIQYGASEVGTITYGRVDATAGRAGPVPVGEPFGDLTLTVQDEDGAVLGPGRVGEVVVSAPRVSRRYLGADPEAAARFSIGSDGRPTYRTGDLGRLDDEGTLTLVGRPDGMVKVRGQRVELAEVSAALLTHPAVREAAALAADGPDGNTELVAHVAAAPGLTRADVVAHVRGVLPAASVPEHVLIHVALPHLPGGKVDHQALARAWDARAGTLDAFPERSAFHDDIELTLAVTVQQLSASVVPDRRTSLLDLGVSSINLAALFVEIERLYGVDLPVTAVVDAPTVAELAQTIRANDARWPTVVSVKATGSRPPLFVVHGAYGNVILAWPLAQALGEDQPVYAIQHPAIDGLVPAETEMADLVDRYVAAIRAVRPSGPYRFFGVSGGGIIALELARALQDDGAAVDLIVMNDTAAPDDPPADAGPRPAYRVGGDQPVVSLRRLRERVGRVRMVRSPLRALRYALVQEARVTQWLASTRRAVARGVAVRPRDRRRFVRDLVEHLFRGYAPPDVDVPVALLRADDTPDPRPDRGWSRWREVRIVPVPGAHDTILLPPNLEPNGRTIRGLLDEAEARRQAAEPSTGTSTGATATAPA